MAMIDFDSTSDAAIATTSRSVCFLITMGFTTGTLYFSTWTSPLTVDGQTYTPIGGALVSISQIKASESNRPDTVVFGFSIVNAAMKAAAIGSAAVWRRRPVAVYLQVLDNGGAPAGGKRLRWRGRMEDVKVGVDRGGKLDRGFGVTEVHCVRAGMDALRKRDGLRITDAQQRQRFPNDVGLEYIQELADKPVPWLTVAFQKI